MREKTYHLYLNEEDTFNKNLDCKSLSALVHGSIVLPVFDIYIYFNV